MVVALVVVAVMTFARIFAVAGGVGFLLLLPFVLLRGVIRFVKVFVVFYDTTEVEAWVKKKKTLL